MKVQGNNIQSIGKKCWRLVEVYIFVIMSTISGSAITKDVVSAKSKAKDKTLQVGTELLVTSASAPPHMAATKNLQTQAASSVAVQKNLNTSKTSSNCAIEKGRAIEKGQLTCAARLFEKRICALVRSLQERVRHTLPFNLITQRTPLLI